MGKGGTVGDNGERGFLSLILESISLPFLYTKVNIIKSSRNMCLLKAQCFYGSKAFVVFLPKVYNLNLIMS